MKRLCLWLVFFALFSIQSVLAQTFLVKGNVVAKVGNEPLIGVTVLQKGSTNGVVTDFDGNHTVSTSFLQNSHPNQRFISNLSNHITFHKECLRHNRLETQQSKKD